MGKPHLTSTKFSSLNLHEALKESLEDNQYEFCTSIQEQTLPKLLEGKDVTGQAQTGTGKTATFLLATLNHLMTVPVSDDKEGPYAIIMAPTRELAVQIYDDAQMLGAYTGLNFALLYGGTGYGRQKAQLENDPDVVIGTVGRILDFFKQRQLNLRNIEVLVLDEADRMFDLGFINDIRYLLRQMPSAEKRKNMLFSATFSQRVLELAYEHMNDPETIKIESEHITADRVEQSLYHVSMEEKLQLLFGLLKREEPKRSIIFVNTKRAADEVYAHLLANNYPAAVLSGDIPQRRRESLLEEFKEGKLSIMVATDVAARGLHIEGVTHVFNYDLPQDVEDYVHRIGRTARAGAAGKAISLACEEYVYSLPEIEEYIKEEIPVLLIDDKLLVKPETPSREDRRNIQQNRNNRSNQQNRRSSRQKNQNEHSQNVRKKSADNDETKADGQQQKDVAVQESVVAPTGHSNSDKQENTVDNTSTPDGSVNAEEKEAKSNNRNRRNNNNRRRSSRAKNQAAEEKNEANNEQQAPQSEEKTALVEQTADQSEEKVAEKTEAEQEQRGNQRNTAARRRRPQRRTQKAKGNVAESAEEKIETRGSRRRYPQNRRRRPNQNRSNQNDSDQGQNTQNTPSE